MHIAKICLLCLLPTVAILVFLCHVLLQKAVYKRHLTKRGYHTMEHINTLGPITFDVYASQTFLAPDPCVTSVAA